MEYVFGFVLAGMMYGLGHVNGVSSESRRIRKGWLTAHEETLRKETEKVIEW